MDTEIIENFNESRLKKILINFERRFNENQKLRIKYSESPARFAGSETELFASLDELQSIATQPELYHVLESRKVLPILMALVSHENTDISAKVIGMVQELTDIDEVEEQDSTESLIKALVEENVIDLLVANLQRLDENTKEESLAINNSLAIIDNLIDFDSKFASRGSKPLIQWMVKQLKIKPEFNSIKLAISELISVLLMNSVENKMYLGELGGIDVLLQQMAYYRRVAPVTGDEHEFLEQIINCLCTAVLDCEQNRKSFLDEEGVDLVELILREKREAVKKSNLKLCTLKLFNHVLTTDKNRDPTVTQCCERFIQVLGLRVLFPIFSKPKIILSDKIKRREYRQTLDEIEEHSAAILLALLKYCQDTSLIQRILIKFAEADSEKLIRLVELHDKYYRLVSNYKLANATTDSDSEDQEAEGEGEGEKERQKEEEKRKSSAYFTLRTIDYIFLLSCYLAHQFETYDPASGETFANRIGKILSRRPEFKHQIVLEVSKHIDEVGANSLEEQNSLELLLRHLEQMNKSVINKVV